MPTPTIGTQTPKPLLFKLGSNSVNGTNATIYNRTTGDIVKVDIQGGNVVYDAANFSSGYSVGDVIECRYNSSYQGSTTITLGGKTSKPQSASITLTAVSLNLISISL